MVRNITSVLIIEASSDLLDNNNRTLQPASFLESKNEIAKKFGGRVQTQTQTSLLLQQGSASISQQESCSGA
jgi:hypothetical protein